MGFRSSHSSVGRCFSAYVAASNIAPQSACKNPSLLVWRYKIICLQFKRIRWSFFSPTADLPDPVSPAEETITAPSSSWGSLTSPSSLVSPSFSYQIPPDVINTSLKYEKARLTSYDKDNRFCDEESRRSPRFMSGMRPFSEQQSRGKRMAEAFSPYSCYKSYSTSSSNRGGNTSEANDSFGADEIAARGWQITEESESDWRGHAAAIARSIQLMKTRMEWTTLLSRLRELDADLSRPDLWNEPSLADKLSRERGGLAGRVKGVKDIESELVEQVGMAELAKEEKDSQVEAEAKAALASLRKVAKEKELTALLSGQHDEHSCFLEVQAGAGGVESMDWAAMILRMYKMWAAGRGYEVSTVEEMIGEPAGIKRATIRVDGEFAYGYAKSEAGVHRLVRISPFDAGKRRHTSFAAVAVMPVLDEAAIKIEIDESDLRIERYRAGGAGGQHVNKTESAVRIVHLPTGIVVQCQADRSQHRNKATALGVLQSRLYQMETARRAQAASQHTETLGDITWGNQIRSYVLQPYQMVKDLRTGYEDSDPTTVLDGGLDGFILSFLASQVRDSVPGQSSNERNS